ncbi:MAG TPA: butyrate kinase, partial [Candidatus Atribacteria bacterium]|nr:butyrate kinase [Candidatus Atribacteria bacterium]
MYKILAINPGATSTKIAVYEDENEIFSKTIYHSNEEISRFKKVSDQYEFRKKTIIDALKEVSFSLDTLSAVVGRGGLLKPLDGGTYLVNEKMVEDLRERPRAEHASNLGALIAKDIASSLGIQAFIVDPVCVDEFEPIARISGLPEIERESLSHALNLKAMAKRYAKEIGKRYEELNLIVVHLGSGISVSAHKKGRMIDVNDASAEGPFAPERSGSVPERALVKLCYSGKYTAKEMEKKIFGEGGMYAYLGTRDA